MRSQPLPPPNRTCGSPASSSPVGGSPLRGLTGFCKGCGLGEQPLLSKEGIDINFFSSFTLTSRAVNMRSVQTLGFTHFHFLGVSGLFNLLRHSRRFSFRLPVLHASTFLPPFAPRPLRRFLATMKALTPGQFSPLPRSPCFTCSAFLTIPSPPTLCAPSAALSRYPSARWVSRFLRSRLHLPLAGSPDTPGRIEFVILRTGRSPPVAPHPTSR